MEFSSKGKTKGQNGECARDWRFRLWRFEGHPTLRKKLFIYSLVPTIITESILGGAAVAFAQQKQQDMQQTQEQIMESLIPGSETFKNEEDNRVSTDGGDTMATKKEVTGTGGPAMLMQVKEPAQDMLEESSQTNVQMQSKWGKERDRLCEHYTYSKAAEYEIAIMKKEQDQNLTTMPQWNEAKTTITSKIKELEQITNDDVLLHEKWQKEGKITKITQETLDREAKKLFGFWASNYLEILDGLATAIMSSDTDAVDYTLNSLKDPETRFINKYGLIGSEFLSKEAVEKTPKINGIPVRLLILNIEGTEAYINYQADLKIDKEAKLMAKLKGKDQVWGKSDGRTSQGTLIAAEASHAQREPRFTVDKLAEVKTSRGAIINASVDPEERGNHPDFDKSVQMAKTYGDSKEEIFWNKMTMIELYRKYNAPYMYKVCDQAEINAFQLLYKAVTEISNNKTMEAAKRMQDARQYQPPVLIASLAIPQKVTALYSAYPKDTTSDSINKTSPYPTVGKEMRDMGAVVLRMDENRFKSLYSAAILKSLFIENTVTIETPEMISNLEVNNPGSLIKIGQTAFPSDIVKKVAALDIKASFKACAPTFASAMVADEGAGMDKGKLAYFISKKGDVEWGGLINWYSLQTYGTSMLRMKGSKLVNSDYVEVTLSGPATQAISNKARLMSAKFLLDGKEVDNKIFITKQDAEKISEFEKKAKKSGLTMSRGNLEYAKDVEGFEISQAEMANLWKAFTAEELDALVRSVKTSVSQPGTYELQYVWEDISGNKHTTKTQMDVTLKGLGQLSHEILGVKYDGNDIVALVKVSGMREGMEKLTFTQSELDEIAKNKKVSRSQLNRLLKADIFTISDGKDILKDNLVMSDKFVNIIKNTDRKIPSGNDLEFNTAIRYSKLAFNDAEWAAMAARGGVLTEEEHGKFVKECMISKIEAESLKKSIGLTDKDVKKLAKAKSDKQKLFTDDELTVMKSARVLTSEQLTKAKKAGILDEGTITRMSQINQSKANVQNLYDRFLWTYKRRNPEELTMGGFFKKEVKALQMVDDKGDPIPNVYEIRYALLQRSKTIPVQFEVEVVDKAEGSAKLMKKRAGAAMVYEKSNSTLSLATISPYIPSLYGNATQRTISNEATSANLLFTNSSVSQATIDDYGIDPSKLERMNDLARSFAYLSGYNPTPIFDKNLNNGNGGYYFVKMSNEDFAKFLSENYGRDLKAERENLKGLGLNVTNELVKSFNTNTFAASIGQMSDDTAKQNVLNLIYYINPEYTIPSGAQYDEARNILNTYGKSALTTEQALLIFSNDTNLGMELGANLQILVSDQTDISLKVDEAVIGIELPTGFLVKPFINISDAPLVGPDLMYRMNTEFKSTGKATIPIEVLKSMDEMQVLSKKKVQEIIAPIKLTEDELAKIQDSGARVSMSKLKSRGYLTASDLEALKMANEKTPGAIPDTVMKRLERFAPRINAVTGEVIKYPAEIDEATFKSVMKHETFVREMSKIIPRGLIWNIYDISTSVHLRDPTSGAEYTSPTYKTNTNAIGFEFQLPYSGLTKKLGLSELGYFRYSVEKPFEEITGRERILSASYRPMELKPIFDVKKVIDNKRAGLSLFGNEAGEGRFWKEAGQQGLSFFNSVTLGALWTATRGPTGNWDYNYKVPVFRLDSWLLGRNLTTILGGNLKYDSSTHRVLPEGVLQFNTRLANFGLEMDPDGLMLSISGKALSLSAKASFEKEGDEIKGLQQGRTIGFEVKKEFYGDVGKLFKGLYRTILNVAGRKASSKTVKTWLDEGGTPGVPKVTQE